MNCARRVRSRPLLLALSFAALAGSAAVLEAMILHDDGCRSVYFVGQIALGVCAIGFVPGPLRLHLPIALTIWGVYALPIALGAPPLDRARAVPPRPAGQRAPPPLLLSLCEEESGGPLYSTAEAIEAKRAELKRLAEVEIPANRKAIEEARAMGDLRENFEYKSARQRHEYLNARVAALHRDLARARPIEHGEFDASEIRIGSAARSSSSIRSGH